MKIQRKKASFNSKCAKFEGKEPLVKKDSLTLQKAKLFEDFEKIAVEQKEAKLRKEEFEKKKNVFLETESDMDDSDGCKENQNTVIKKKLSVFEQQDCLEGHELVLDQQKRKEDFIEKQSIFGQ